MKTIEETQTIMTTDNTILDFDSTDILKEMIVTKLESLGSELNGKHFYSLKVTKTPTRTDYHTFSFDKLSEISRKLINGQTTLGGITNRQFWGKNFNGGLRILNVEQNPVGTEFPSFNILFIVYSEFDNLDVKIQKNLSIRLRNIDPTLTYTLKYIGNFNCDGISHEIPEFNYEEYPQTLINKLGEETIHRIYDLEFQTPKYFGRLFKSKTK